MSFETCSHCRAAFECTKVERCFLTPPASKLADVEKRLHEAIERNRKQRWLRRIDELQARTALTPGEEMELKLLLKIKWGATK